VKEIVPDKSIVSFCRLKMPFPFTERNA